MKAGACAYAVVRFAFPPVRFRDVFQTNIFFAGGAGGTAGARGCGAVGAGSPAPRLRCLKGKLPPEGRAVHRTG